MRHKHRKDIGDIFNAGLDAANPKEAINRAVRQDDGNVLWVRERPYDLNQFKRILVVGAGKAAAPMAQAMEDLLGGRLTGGSITTKYGHGLPLKIVSITEAGHPVPDRRGLSGTERILKSLKNTQETDLIFCLISGGGSALMPLPVEGLTLEDKQKTTQALLDCGATIHEINAIRKHISAIKGGKLARAASPGTVVSLILSDVIGDDLDTIASGPTVPDHSTFQDCMNIIAVYELADKIPAPVMAYLRRGEVGKEEETPKPGDPLFDKAASVIIGSASLSLDAAAARARDLGYNTVILSSCIEGETRDVAKVHAAIGKEVLKSGNPLQRPACVISGGETTVTIHGEGLGGRNTEFVLAAAIELEGINGITVLSGGTDGTDGPTDAAGAVADGETCTRAVKGGMNAGEYLRNNDSYHFFEAAGGLIKTGPTMTNVMDLRIMLIG
ncbi:MAG: glycerate kinase [Deltaproteobacteria bacterium]|nr:glycerate kinase [Deltaproteobacteria bacterium]